jgi:hypothetical protein
VEDAVSVGDRLQVAVVVGFSFQMLTGFAENCGHRPGWFLT